MYSAGPVTYARLEDGVSLGYQVTGDGDLDLVVLPLGATPLDVMWDEASFVRFASRLGHLSRTVCYEFRGSGASGGHVMVNLAP